jgi:hypothetical protein
VEASGLARVVVSLHPVENSINPRRLVDDYAVVQGVKWILSNALIL